MADDEELKAAEDRGLARGLRIGRLERETFRVLPALGDWLPEARLVFRHTWFASYADHWRRLVENLREVQRVRWLLEFEPDAVPAVARDFAPRLAQLEEEYHWEVLDVCFSAEDLLEEGCGRACVLAVMQATPQRPATVVELDTAREFIEKDERRGTVYPTHIAIRPDAAYGHDWRLEDPFRRWQTTSWKIGWLCGSLKEMREGLADDPLLADEAAKLDAESTHEVYAVETLDPADPWAEDGRVWILGTVKKRALVEETLREMERKAMRDRNSLVAAAEAVASAQREDEAEFPPDQRRL